MSDGNDEKTFGQKCSHEFNELCCKPKARCFKGLAILSGIYTVACGLMLMIIPPVVEAHGYREDGPVPHDLKSMKISTVILLCVFLALTVVNLLVCKVYDSREKRHEQIVSGNLISDENFQQFHEEDDDNRHIEER